eukprot:CAMPEP_0177641694 /NCGR_PEP_ID=MMETSP0447-20121125/7199_1 /TAXON_ID=0 /ORGANISM="Stygamoeba regulata, Strain BSH-02190019" /LENGTH=426 /DNA_ID=CAMNT_0019143821 /DNA_START=45 /DNA_END=1327 /DNA_ORIENTATION=-
MDGSSSSAPGRFRRTMSHPALLDSGKTIRNSLKKSASFLSHKAKEVQNSLGEPSETVKNRVILGLISLPLLPVVFYAVYLLLFVHSTFLSVYIALTVLYYMFLLAFIVTEICIRPPWYNPTRPKDGLTLDDMPAYWQEQPKYDLDLDYEDVEFPTDGGVILRGWFVPAPSRRAAQSKTGVVFVHGGGCIPPTRTAIPKEGYGCLLFDFREHGISDGKGRGFSYGLREHKDVISAVRFMRSAFAFDRVVVCGTSVGASSAILAASIEPTIDGVIAENPVADIDEFAVFHLKKVVKHYTNPWIRDYLLLPLYMLVNLMFHLRVTGLVHRYVAPVSVIKRISPRPILLMHGTADDIVPLHHSERLHDAAGENKSFWVAHDSWHCALFDKYPDEFQARVHAFMRAVEQQDGQESVWRAESEPSTGTHHCD